MHSRDLHLRVSWKIPSHPALLATSLLLVMISQEGDPLPNSATVSTQEHMCPRMLISVPLDVCPGGRQLDHGAAEMAQPCSTEDLGSVQSTHIARHHCLQF